MEKRQKDKKWNLTKEELIKKINDERQTFQMALEHKDKEAAAAVAAVRKVCDQVIARVIRCFGRQVGDEYVLEIPVPDCPEGHFWGTKVEQIDKKTWKLHCKLYEIPDMKKEQGR